MRFTDIGHSLLIILIFAMCFLVAYLSNGIIYIKRNWSKFKCNPAIIPFASVFGHNTRDTFNSCIGGIQHKNMGKFLSPIKDGQDMMNQSMGATTKTLNNLNLLQGHFQSLTSMNFMNVYGVFKNVLIEFQKFVLGFKDMMMKILGIVATMVYMLSGQNMLGTSIVKGPVMTTLKTIGDGASIIGL